jgi:hypothetical protein
MPRPSKTHHLFLALGLLAMSGLWGACTEKTPCDEGQELRGGYCYPLLPGQFGAPCKTNAECSAPAPYCAIQPGATTGGICSAFGCIEDPNLCPSTWSCMDLSQQYQVQMSICVPGSPVDAGALDTAEGETGSN